VVSVYDAKNLYLVDDASLTPLETGRGTYMSYAPLALNGGLVFSGPLEDKGTELLFTDGTEGGTRIVAQVVAGPGSSSPKSLAVSRGRLFFSAEDKDGDRELYAVPLTALP
jgi:ELWxxDGT repeat protein